jgi:hypothetical protein
MNALTNSASSTDASFEFNDAGAFAESASLFLDATSARRKNEFEL